MLLSLFFSHSCESVASREGRRAEGLPLIAVQAPGGGNEAAPLTRRHSRLKRFCLRAVHRALQQCSALWGCASILLPVRYFAHVYLAPLPTTYLSPTFWVKLLGIRVGQSCSSTRGCKNQRKRSHTPPQVRTKNETVAWDYCCTNSRKTKCGCHVLSPRSYLTRLSRQSFKAILAPRGHSPDFVADPREWLRQTTHLGVSPHPHPKEEIHLLRDYRPTKMCRFFVWFSMPRNCSAVVFFLEIVVVASFFWCTLRIARVNATMASCFVCSCSSARSVARRGRSNNRQSRLRRTELGSPGERLLPPKSEAS